MHALRLLDSTGGADAARKRSLLYITASCALAFACELVVLAGPEAYAGRQGAVWQLWLLAFLSGAMALWIRRMHGNADAADAARSREDEPLSVSGLADLGSWRSARARDFSKFDMHYLPPLPPTEAGASNSRRAAARKKTQTKAADPWAKVLDEFESQGKEHP